MGRAFQQTLFADDAASRVAVSDQYAFEFHPQAYAPSRDYDGRFGPFEFRKHFYGRIGDFDSKEEFECACWLRHSSAEGPNPILGAQSGSARGQFLLSPEGRRAFLPGFPMPTAWDGEEPGPTLAVEYKGADRWNDAKDDRLIGGLWASLSGGAAVCDGQGQALGLD